MCVILPECLSEVMSLRCCTVQASHGRDQLYQEPEAAVHPQKDGKACKHAVEEYSR